MDMLSGLASLAIDTADKSISGALDTAFYRRRNRIALQQSAKLQELQARQATIEKNGMMAAGLNPSLAGAVGNGVTQASSPTSISNMGNGIDRYMLGLTEQNAKMDLQTKDLQNQNIKQQNRVLQATATKQDIENRRELNYDNQINEMSKMLSGLENSNGYYDKGTLSAFNDMYDSKLGLSRREYERVNYSLLSHIAEEQEKDKDYIPSLISKVKSDAINSQLDTQGKGVEIGLKQLQYERNKEFNPSQIANKIVKGEANKEDYAKYILYYIFGSWFHEK